VLWWARDDLQRISTERFIDDELLDRVEQITAIMQSVMERTNQKEEPYDPK